MKYLLVMHCEKDGYWDTSGYCCWSTPEYFRESEFDVDDKEGLTRAIASFKFEYPKGEISLYKIEEMTWDDTNEFYETEYKLWGLSREKYWKIYKDNAPKCPACGTPQGFSFGTGDCGCDVGFTKDNK
jgi:hypothetical protein